MFLFLKENLLKIILILVLLVTLVYVVKISSIPENILLFENEEFSIDTIAGLKLKETIPVTSNLGKRLSQEENNNLGERKYSLSLLGWNIKTITTNTIPTTKVIPLGNLVGVKLYTDGVLVVGVSEVKGEDNKIYNYTQG